MITYTQYTRRLTVVGVHERVRVRVGVRVVARRGGRGRRRAVQRDDRAARRPVPARRHRLRYTTHNTHIIRMN